MKIVYFGGYHINVANVAHIKEHDTGQHGKMETVITFNFTVGTDLAAYTIKVNEPAKALLDAIKAA